MTLGVYVVSLTDRSDEAFCEKAYLNKPQAAQHSKGSLPALMNVCEHCIASTKAESATTKASSSYHGQSGCVMMT